MQLWIIIKNYSVSRILCQLSLIRFLQHTCMRVIHKYITKELISISFISISVFVLVLIMGNALKDLMQQVLSDRISLFTCFKLIGYLMPKVIPYAIPIGVLISILTVLGRLSASNELTAMRTAGISMISICKPIFYVVGLATAISMCVEGYYAPLSRIAYRRALASLAQHTPGRFIQPGVFIKEFPGYILYVDERIVDHLKGVSIWELNPNGSIKVFLKAKEGYLTHLPVEQALSIKLVEGSVQQQSSAGTSPFELHPNIVTFKTFSIRFPLSKIFNDGNSKSKLSGRTLLNLINDFHKIRYTETIEPEILEHKRFQVLLEMNKRLSMAGAVIALAFIGIPLGIKVGRKETTINFFIAVGLGLIYYAAVICFSYLDNKPRYHPYLCIWIPNLVCYIVGMYSLRKLIRL